MGLTRLFFLIAVIALFFSVYDIEWIYEQFAVYSFKYCKVSVDLKKPGSMSACQANSFVKR